MNSFAPIALFVFNRPFHTKETVEALKKNTLAKNSKLFIFSDGPKNKETEGKVAEVRNYLKTISGFEKVTIIEKEENSGLANSIIAGVTEIVNKYGKIIVVEDDLVTSPYFLEYMNDGLNLYKDEERVISIHGYTYPTKKELPETFFIKGSDCWGWATWKRGWDIFEKDGKKLLEELKQKKLTKSFDFNGYYNFTEMLERQTRGKISSWAIRWYASAFLSNKLTLYPGKTLVKNIGNDDSGTHCRTSDVFGDIHSIKKTEVCQIQIEEDAAGKKAFQVFFKATNPKKPSFPTRAFRKIIRIIKSYGTGKNNT